MKTHALALATGLMALTFANPVLAAGRHDNHHGRQQVQQHRQAQQAAHQRMQRQQIAQRQQMQQRQRMAAQRQQSHAYAQGYRDGARNSRVPVYSSRPYVQTRAPVYYSTPPRYSNASYPNQYWWGQNGRMNCRRSDGTVGTLVGAVAGGVLGNMIAQQGDKQMGTIIGGALGGLLGNQVAKGNLSCR